MSHVMLITGSLRKNSCNTKLLKYLENFLPSNFTVDFLGSDALSLPLFNEDLENEIEYKLAFDLAEKKFRSCKHLEPEKIYGRIAGALARKGFSAGLTSRIVRELLESASSN